MIRDTIKDIKEKAEKTKEVMKDVPKNTKEAVAKEVQFINEAEAVNKTKLDFVNKLIFFVCDLLLVVMIISVVFHFVNFGLISGESMEPTYHDRERFVSVKNETYEQFDVVIFTLEDDSDEETVLIKRVMAVAGDTIYAEDGKVYVNGQTVSENYSMGDTDDFDAVTLGEGEYFLMGDNRENSYDSRMIGPVDDDVILGKVVKVW